MIKLNCQKEKSTKEKDILTNFLFPYAISNVYQNFRKILPTFHKRYILLSDYSNARPAVIGQYGF